MKLVKKRRHSHFILLFFFAKFRTFVQKATTIISLRVHDLEKKEFEQIEFLERHRKIREILFHEKNNKIKLSNCQESILVYPSISLPPFPPVFFKCGSTIFVDLVTFEKRGMNN